MTVDNRTPNLDLPLPYIDNQLDFDVGRLVSALMLLDTAVAARATSSEMNTAITGYLATSAPLGIASYFTRDDSEIRPAQWTMSRQCRQNHKRNEGAMPATMRVKVGS